MKPRILALLLGLFVTPAFAVEPPVVVSTTTGVSLAECFKAAQHLSETLGISEENIRLVEAQYREQLGTILPHISFIKQQFFQQNVNSGNSGNATGSFLKSTQPESYFQLQQPLFSGFRDWAAIDIAKSQQVQSRFNVQAADEQLLSDVATAFFTAVALDEELAVLYETQKLTNDRIKQLNHWVDIGRSREAEVLSAQSELTIIEAQIEDQKRSQAESRQLLQFLTAVPPERLLLDEEPVQSPLSEEQALTRAEKRPDLQVAMETLRQAGYSIRYAKGDFWPTLSLTADYYVERFGFQDNVRWDATFLLTVPLFSGFSSVGGLKAARSQEVVAQLTLNRLKRDIQRQVRTAVDDLRFSTSQAAAYDKAVQLADRNYHMQEKEYRLGLITNIELLQLLSQLQQTKNQWLEARSAARLNAVRLRVAMGEGLP